KVDSILYYAGAVRIVYMMFLSYGGFQLRSPIPRTLADDAICGLHAIHQLGVLQGDPAARNILVHPDRPGITWIDFERAEFIRPRAVLGSLSPNRKRKGSWSHEEGKCQYRKDSKKTPASEIRQATAELATLVVKQRVITSTDASLTQPGTLPGAQPEYVMTQIKTWGLTGDADTFRKGAAAYRNGRDWAKRQRDSVPAPEKK
ncbi:hypothetical protein V500_10127, partial [Pseudogymnoascus sp. VKM F-4518 (FW-2643)]